MDNNIKDIKLNEIERSELEEGNALYEMTKTPGWAIMKRWLEDMAFHSWVDPREVEGENPEKELMFRYLNGFHAANNARELMERIQTAVSRSEFLEKKKRGEIQTKDFRI